MKLGDVSAYALNNLRQHKLRTGLTVCGVAVGVATLTLLVSLGFGLEAKAIEQFQGAELATRINVLPEGTKDRIFRGVRRVDGDEVPLTDEVVQALGKLPGVVVAYPGVYSRVVAESPRQVVAPLDVEGLPEDALTEEFSANLLAGRYWEPHEAGRVGVLPSNVLRHLGYDEPEEALGAELALSRLDSLLKYRREVFDAETGEPIPEDAGPPAPGAPQPKKRVRFIRPEGLETLAVEVVGVYDSDRFGYMGERLHVPLPLAKEIAADYGLMQPLGGDVDSYQMAVVKVEGPSDVEPVRKAIEAQGFDTMTVFDLLWILKWIFVVFEMVLGLFGGIGLLVAFFGIANTMVMAVLERTREIGVLKALGARNRDVRRMVFFEASAIGLAGGGVGLLVGWAIGRGLELLAAALFGESVEPGTLDVFDVPGVLVAVALALSTLVAAVAGIYPAWRAARLDPVVSLRTE